MFTARQSPRRAGPPSFTLVEMVIVVGIVAVLTAITLPTAFSLIREQRTRLTLATMKVLESAIEAFVRDNPFAGSQGCANPVLREIVLPTTPPTILDYKLRLSANAFLLFDRYPPSPTTAFSVDPTHPETFVSNGLMTIDNQVLPGPPYPATKENDEDPPSGASSREATESKLLRLINVMKGFDSYPPGTCGCHNHCAAVPWEIHHDPMHPTEKYASIECLVFALHEFSPQARAILAKLPNDAWSNIDKDFAYHDQFDGQCNPDPDCQFNPNCEEQVNLGEIVDGWKRPLRYAIREASRDPMDPTKGFAFKWELRSAGDDGVFSPPFTPADRSDDVILQGP